MHPQNLCREANQIFRNLPLKTELLPANNTIPEKMMHERNGPWFLREDFCGLIVLVDDVQWVGLGMTFRGVGVSKGLLCTSFETAREINQCRNNNISALCLGNSTYIQIYSCHPKKYVGT